MLSVFCAFMAIILDITEKYARDSLVLDTRTCQTGLHNNGQNRSKYLKYGYSKMFYVQLFIFHTIHSIFKSNSMY